MSFFQRGGCVCGDVRLRVEAEPLTVYACHCTDCQTLSGASFTLSVVVQSGALHFEGGDPPEFEVTLPDGRTKGGLYCPRCHNLVAGRSREAPITLVDGGVFDDTRWIEPVAHIWVRSAQPWLRLDPDTLHTEQQPTPEEQLEMVRRWRSRA